jgi:hypothetical protein
VLEIHHQPLQAKVITAEIKMEIMAVVEVVVHHKQVVLLLVQQTQAPVAMAQHLRFRVLR